MNKLNKVIDYIERNLDGEISFRYLARLAGVNQDTLSRIFIFLTRISIYEYIRKRRLSKAYEDLRNTKLRVIDIAIRYSYNSTAAFSRAFKKEFGLTPLQARKSRGRITIFPKLLFQGDIYPGNGLEAEIMDFPTTTLYGIMVTSKEYEGLLYKIRRLYSQLRASGLYRQWDQFSRYGIYYTDKSHCYFVGTEHREDDLTEFRLIGGRYAVFHLNSRRQKEIIKLEEKIYKQWLPATNFMVGKGLNFELYHPHGVDLYFSIR